MNTSKSAPLIACVNSSEDIVMLLADVLKGEGFRAVTHVSPTMYGPEKVIDFLAQLQPLVTVITISLPYDQAWRDFQAVQEALPKLRFVVTTTNKRALDEIVGPTPAFEVIGKPFDIEEIIGAVRRAVPSQME